LHYHFVFIRKYRKPVLRGEVALRFWDLIREIAGSHDVQIVKGHVRPDHVHLMLSMSPQVSVGRCESGASSVAETMQIASSGSA
jgi:putative transposase